MRQFNDREQAYIMAVKQLRERKVIRRIGGVGNITNSVSHEGEQGFFLDDVIDRLLMEGTIQPGEYWNTYHG